MRRDERVFWYEFTKVYAREAENLIIGPRTSASELRGRAARVATEVLHTMAGVYRREDMKVWRIYAMNETQLRNGEVVKLYVQSPAGVRYFLEDLAKNVTA